MQESSVVNSLSASLAQQTGVAQADVTKILTALGVNALVANISETAGAERLKTIKVGDLRIAARLARGGMAI